MNIKIKEKNNMKNFLTGMKMKNILNKISLKGLFVVLLLVVFCPVVSSASEKVDLPLADGYVLKFKEQGVFSGAQGVLPGIGGKLPFWLEKSDLYNISFPWGGQKEADKFCLLEDSFLCEIRKAVSGTEAVSWLKYARVGPEEVGNDGKEISTRIIRETQSGDSACALYGLSCLSAYTNPIGLHKWFAFWEWGFNIKGGEKRSCAEPLSGGLAACDPRGYTEFIGKQTVPVIGVYYYKENLQSSPIEVCNLYSEGKANYAPARMWGDDGHEYTDLNREYAKMSEFTVLCSQTNKICCDTTTTTSGRTPGGVIGSSGPVCGEKIEPPPPPVKDPPAKEKTKPKETAPVTTPIPGPIPGPRPITTTPTTTTITTCEPITFDFDVVPSEYGCVEDDLGEKSYIPKTGNVASFDVSWEVFGMTANRQDEAKLECTASCVDEDGVECFSDINAQEAGTSWIGKKDVTNEKANTEKVSVYDVNKDLTFELNCTLTSTSTTGVATVVEIPNAKLITWNEGGPFDLDESSDAGFSFNDPDGVELVEGLYTKNTLNVGWSAVLREWNGHEYDNLKCTVSGQGFDGMEEVSPDGDRLVTFEDVGVYNYAIECKTDKCGPSISGYEQITIGTSTPEILKFWAEPWVIGEEDDDFSATTDLHWETKNAKYCTIASGDGTEMVLDESWSNLVANGSKTTPIFSKEEDNGTKWFNLTCYGYFDGEASATTKTELRYPPKIIRFEGPVGPVSIGEDVMLTWATERAESCWPTSYWNDGAWLEAPSNPNDSEQVGQVTVTDDDGYFNEEFRYFDTPGTYKFGIRCGGSGGVTEEAIVTVEISEPDSN
ncbi:hypothetical protein M0R04_16525 [Candidatus Dojkabacteria bacterium]|jgi:hypothetical protein|nr:hypothetical protein [Candidatus Dojkabacteria bacterium]